jgi:hypothetical protein
MSAMFLRVAGRRECDLKCRTKHSEIDSFGRVFSMGSHPPAARPEKSVVRLPRRPKRVPSGRPRRSPVQRRRSWEGVLPPKDDGRALTILPKREFATIRAYPDLAAKSTEARVAFSLGLERRCKGVECPSGVSQSKQVPSDWNCTDSLNPSAPEFGECLSSANRPSRAGYRQEAPGYRPSHGAGAGTHEKITARSQDAGVSQQLTAGGSGLFLWIEPRPGSDEVPSSQILKPKRATRAATSWPMTDMIPGRSIGHPSVAATVRFTTLAPDRFKGFWKD